MSALRSLCACRAGVVLGAVLTIGLAGCDGGAPETGTQVQDPPPIPSNMDMEKMRGSAPAPGAGDEAKPKEEAK